MFDDYIFKQININVWPAAIHEGLIDWCSILIWTNWALITSPVRYLLPSTFCILSFELSVFRKAYSSLSCSSDRAARWMMAPKSASGRKPFCFRHLLKYESTGSIAERAAIHLSRSCSIWSCCSCWLLSLHSLLLHLPPYPPLHHPIISTWRCCHDN